MSDESGRKPSRHCIGRRVLVALTAIGGMLPIATHGASAEATARSGKEVVDAVCMECHGPGKLGAPRIGDQKAWSKRAAQGLTSLTEHALSGIRKMPSHGGSPALTDLEIRRAVAYMVNQSGGNWVEPVSAKEAAAARSGEQIVKAQCAKCHRTGEGGAPRIGDKNAWTPRMKQGLDNLSRSAIRGHGGMPPRGGQANLTDTEIRNAVLYMFNPAATAGKDEAAAGVAKVATPVRPLSNYVKTAGDMEIHLGLLPAEKLRQYPKGSPEASMHGGVPRGSGYYHLNVSLIDGPSQTVVADARVETKVEQVGLSSTSKLMEPIRFDNLTSYGNYFKLSGRTSYRITVTVQKPGSKQVTRSQFEHRVN